MEMISAMVVAIDEKHFIEINIENEKVSIPLSEDKPNEVKRAFNDLVGRLKEGEFQIELEQVGQDLFSQVAKEYITQLNRELLEVRSEMEEYGLVKNA